MKVFLMHADQDFDLRRELPANEDALTRDLELDTLFSAMAAGDAYLLELAKRACCAASTIRRRSSTASTSWLTVSTSLSSSANSTGWPSTRFEPRRRYGEACMARRTRSCTGRFR